jgi:hypothetical protein
MRGQALIEVLIAIAIGVLILTSATVSTVGSLGNMVHIKSQSDAKEYAQEGIDIMENMQTINASTFYGETIGKYCLPLTCAPGGTKSLDITCLTPYSPGACVIPVPLNPKLNINYIRTVTFANSCGDSSPGIEKLVQVNVSWTDSKCDIGHPLCNSYSINNCFNDYQSP